MAEVTILFVLAVLWLAERGKVRRRLAELEAGLDELRQARAQQRSAPAPAAASPPPPAAAPAPPRPPPVAPRAAVAAEPAAAPAAPAAHDYGIGTGRAADGAPPPRRAAVPPPVPAPEPLLPQWLREFISGGNLIVRVGVVVLFFGVAFLLRYAAEHSQLSVEWRLTAVAAGALVLLGLGWHWRSRRRGYALALQGGGVGTLYLTVFAALHHYAVLSAGAAFALLAAVAALAAALAILQDSLAFAMLGAIGGYLAPLLTAEPHGNHVVLFSYFALLDLAVVAIAWFRSWRPLNLLAFVCTYGIGTLWGVLRYQPEHLPSTEPFVILFFAMFVAIAVLFALREAPRLSDYVDGTLVFGTPVMTLGLQSALVRHVPYALAYSALALGAVYLLLASQLRRRGSLQLLVEAFLALGVAFATLAIPFALDGRWTAASWALEGAAVLWVGLRQQRRLAVAAGLALQLLAGLAYGAEWPALLHGPAGPVIANSRYLSAVLVSAAGLICAATLRRAGPAWLEPWRPALGATLLGWALAWWLGAGLAEIDRQVAADFVLAGSLAFVAATALAAGAAGRRADWDAARLAALLLVPALAVFAYAGRDLAHPLAGGGWWAWPVALAAAYYTLARDEALAAAVVQTALHTLGLWLVAWLATAELGWQLGEWLRESGTWAAAARGLVPGLALLAAARGRRWPFAAQRAAYAQLGAAGLSAYLLGWVVYSAATADGSASPLPYVPLVNPMDAAEALALVALGAALGALGDPRASAAARRLAAPARLVVAIAAFAWLNALLLRTLHHYASLPYDAASIAASTLAQTAMTIFWTVLALAAMVWASRAGRRIGWVAGAVLLSIVIAKLFLVDLSRTGTVPRIVSFIGVGVLMLVIGYFSPLPPRATERNS